VACSCASTGVTKSRSAPHDFHIGEIEQLFCGMSIAFSATEGD